MEHLTREMDTRSFALQLVEAVPEPLVVADGKGEVVFLNGPCREVFGYRSRDLRGRPLETLLPGLGNGAVPDPDAGTVTLDARRSDGGSFPAEVAFAPALWEGEELLVAIIRDLSEQERTERELRHTRDALAEAQRLARLGSWEWDIPDNRMTWSDELFRIYGLEPGAVIPSNGALLDRVHPDDRDSVDARNRKAVADGQPFEDVKRCMRADGSEFLMRTVGEVVTGDDGKLLRMLGVCEDVTVAQEAERAKAELTALFESIDDAIYAATPEGVITSWNPGAERLFGYSAEEAIGRTVDMLIPDDFLIDDDERAVQLAGGGAVSQHETRRVRKDGSVIDVSLGLSPLLGPDDEVVAITRIGRDITERKRVEAQLKRLADRDPLTGLLNRRRFAEELGSRVAHARRYSTRGAVLMLDLDNFKYVNDAFGHGAGDELLRSTGRLLHSRLRESDVLARLGGDEFAVILPEADEFAANEVVSSLLNSLREHVVPLDGRPLRITASIGIAFYDSEAANGEEVLAEADGAMYAAKDGGRDRARTAAAAAESGATETRLGWEHRIHRALEEGQFVLYCQPIIGLRSGEICQHELLLRMQDGDELITPGAFLGVAERLGMVGKIDRWVVGEALRLLTDHPSLRLEVNLSAHSLDDHGLLELIQSGVSQREIDPGRLIFEITETAAIGRMDVARKLAQSLAELGCEFALDDFGAGFGSFYYLKHLPARYLKIDGDFVRAPRSRADELVIDAIVGVAQGLGKETIAEFVEDEATLEMVREAGVDYAQGFHISEPFPVQQLGRA